MRYLKKNTEETGNAWSGELASLLREIHRERKTYIEAGETCFPEEKKQDYQERYRCIVEDGRKENHQTENRYAREEEKALLNHLEKYMGNHLLFMECFKVPFDNNISEKDLRKVKNWQKMAGGFRKESGKKMYCLILSIVETLKRRNRNLMEDIKLHRNIGYFLAGVKSDGSAGRLNCYVNSNHFFTVLDKEQLQC